MTSEVLRRILVAAACVAALSTPALAAAPTAVNSAVAFTSYPSAAYAVGDLGVTVAGTSTAVARITNATGTGFCEGFTTLAAQLQRASVDPNGPYSAQVVWSSSGSALAANGSTAITEAGLGWYRWNITALTGTGNCLITTTPK